MYFQQPPLFPAMYLNTSMKITYSPFATNASDVAGGSLIVAQSATSIVSTDFTSTFTFDSIPYSITLADIGYDGRGGLVLASFLDCLLKTLNITVRINSYIAYNQCYPVLISHVNCFQVGILKLHQ